MVKILLLGFLLCSLQVKAASCCGSAGSSSNLILGDFQKQVKTSFSNALLIGSVDQDKLSEFRDNPYYEQKRILNLEAAFHWRENLQYGFSLPIQQNKIGEYSGMHLGDIGANINWEFLPELEYSPWKPRGFLLVQVLFPTGKSIYNSSSDLNDYSGSGAYAVGLSSLFYKVHGDYDFLFNWGILKKMDIRSKDSEKVSFAPQSNIGISAGYSPRSAKDHRIGLSLSGLHKGRTLSSIYGASRESLVWDLGIHYSYMLRDNHSISLSYIDQTLVGPAYNTDLERRITTTYSLSEFL